MNNMEREIKMSSVWLCVGSFYFEFYEIYQSFIYFALSFDLFIVAKFFLASCV